MKTPAQDKVVLMVRIVVEQAGRFLNKIGNKFLQIRRPIWSRKDRGHAERKLLWKDGFRRSLFLKRRRKRREEKED